jgi:hypothetical protein
MLHYCLNDNAANTNVADSKGSNTGGLLNNSSGLSASGKINAALTFSGTERVLAGSAVSDYRVPLFINGGHLDAGGEGLTGTTALESNVWYHVVATYDSSATLTFYVNGTSDGTLSSYNGGANTWSVCLWIKSIPAPSGYSYASVTVAGEGAWSSVLSIGDDPANSGFVGYIDDFRIYGHCLITNEIALIYNGGTGTESE